MTARPPAKPEGDAEYDAMFGGVSRIVEAARQTAARAVNALMTAAYRAIGRYIVEFEQEGRERADYGGRLVERLSADLSARYGRGFSLRNLWQMRAFYLAWPLAPAARGESISGRIPQTASAESVLEGVAMISSAESAQEDIVKILSTEPRIGRILQTLSAECVLEAVAPRFPLPWSAYVRPMALENPRARAFYETEALRGGWTVRQLERQIGSQFYERTALSRDKAAMLRAGENALPGDRAEDYIKDPYVLEFLDLKDEYSETDLEDAPISRLQTFLQELGEEFAFVARQKRLRVGNEWYRVDLLFFHRRLRCLVVVDLKIGKFTHADAGQMHLYCNYARENWAMEGENPPIGPILCSQRDTAVARYALDGLPNKVVAVEYRTALPDEDVLAREIARTRAALNARRGPPRAR